MHKSRVLARFGFKDKIDSVLDALQKEESHHEYQKIVWKHPVMFDEKQIYQSVYICDQNNVENASPLIFTFFGENEQKDHANIFGEFL